ncbi:MAG: hypothetical protein CMN30_03955 [Sandaracinus sp.]|nr:hypothetical protein [Sandaracinus sp.]
MLALTLDVHVPCRLVRYLARRARRSASGARLSLPPASQPIARLPPPSSLGPFVPGVTGPRKSVPPIDGSFQRHLVLG